MIITFHGKPAKNNTKNPAEKTNIPVPRSGCLAISANGIAIITKPKIKSL